MTFQQYPFKGGVPTGTTAQRPGSPAIGDVFYNGTEGILEIYNGTDWVPCSAPAGTPVVSAIDVGTSRAYGSGGLSFTFTPQATGGSPLGYTAVSTTASTATVYQTTTSSTTVTLTVGNNGTYNYYGNSYNGFGTSPNSVPSTVEVTTLPQAPTIGTATAATDANAITVTWTNGSNGGKNLSAITITPYLNGTTAATSRTAATTSSTSYTFTQGQLTGDSSYTFKVKATNANGDSLESSASNSATMPTGVSVTYLVIAGGGGGGQGANTANESGGGGAGGYRSSVVGESSGRNSTAQTSFKAAFSTNYTVTVGGGGAQNVNGSNSVFNTVTSTGGGRGGSNSAGASGGCGGGGSHSTQSGGAGTAGEGFDGGTPAQSSSAAGGGGAGGAAASAVQSSVAGTGGVGISSSITGTATFRAGGGGGGNPGTTNTGGNGGGGRGAGPSGNGDVTAGTANTGGGGGGALGSSSANAQPGGSGVVILRYPTAEGTISIGAGLTGSTTTVGSNTVATFTAGSGNVSWT